MDGDMLKSYCRDILTEAKARDHVSGRDKETTTTVGIPFRKSKGNLILVGEPGVGKIAIVEGLAQRIVAGDVPISLKDVKIYSLEIRELLTSTRYRGEFETKFQKLMVEIHVSIGKVVLFIDKIHLALGAGRVEGVNVDVANLLSPILLEKARK